MQYTSIWRFGSMVKARGRAILKKYITSPIALIQLRGQKDLKLHLGCGNQHLEGYVNVDISPASSADIVVSAERLPFLNGCASEIFTSHMIEHIPRESLNTTIIEWHRLLAPNGRLVIRCPNFELYVHEWLKGNYDWRWGWGLRPIFGIDGAASSNHITDRIRGLLSRDEQVTIVCATQPDLTQLSSYSEHLNVHFIDPNDHFAFHPVHRKYESMRRRIWGLLCGGPDALLSPYGWEHRAIAYISRNIDLVSFDICYSTGGSTGAHLVGKWISNQVGIPWVAEVQDPIVHNYNTNHITQCFRMRLDKIERLLKESDVLLTLTKNCKHHYEMKYGWEHVVSLYPGTSVPLSYALSETRTPSTEKLRLFYAGSLASSRNLEVLVDSILAQQIDHRVEVIIAGDIDTPNSQLITKHDFLHYLGRLSRLEVHNRLMDTDLALVIQHRDPLSSLTIPSKFYEYAALGVPILFLGYQNAEVESNADLYNFFYADQSNPRQVQVMLQHLVEQESTLKKPTIPYDLETATNEFLSLCRHVIINRKGRTSCMSIAHSSL